MADMLMDPDRLALSLVQQYLIEHNYLSALAALEREAGVRYVQDALPQGSQLLAMVYERIEAQLSAALKEAGGEEGRLRQLDDALLQDGKLGGENFPRRLAATMQLPANVICMECWPAAREPGTLLAAGCMDGSVHLLDASDPSAPRLRCSAQPHRKYVVVLRWSPCGRYLVAGSWDHTFSVLTLSEAGCSAGQPSSSGSGGKDGTMELTLAHTEQCGGQVLAAEFMPSASASASTSGGGGSGSGSGETGAGRPTFIVALRRSNYLRQYAIYEGAAGGGGGGDVVDRPSASGSGGQLHVEAVRRVNTNAAMDDYVSFSAMHLAVSPCGRFLLVSADNGRLIMLEVEGWTQIRNFYGLPIEQYHQFTAAWHADGRYIFAAAAHGWVHVFHVGSAKVVEKFKAHEKNVRGLCYDAPNNLLLTCSFDRTIKLFER